MSDTNPELEATAAAAAAASASAAATRTSRQSKWDIMFQYLREYTEMHGHALVPNRYEPFPPLGAWVSTQRRHYKTYMEEMERLPGAGKKTSSTPLSAERIQLLESIGFVWSTTDPRHVPWEDRYNELCEYKEVHGNCLVPMGYKENPQLANWVSTQRQEWKLLQTGKPCRITQDKIDKLDELGFSWEAVRGGKRKKRAGAASAEGAAAPKKKKASAKTAAKKTATEEGATASGTATATQATANEAPVAAAAAAAAVEENWDDMFEALMQFKTKTGNTNVTNRYKDKPGLAGWVANQRREYTLMKELEAGIADDPNATCSLTEDRVRQLESIGFEFKARKPGRPTKGAAATRSAPSAAADPTPTGNLKVGDDEEVFVDAIEIPDAEQDEGTKDDKPSASSDTVAKKRVKKNIPKGNAGKVNAEVGGGVKDAAEMLYSLGGA